MRPEQRNQTSFQRFFRTETFGGVILLAGALVALVVANSPWAGAYHHLWEMRIAIGPAARPLSLTLHQWVNDGLMTVFFLLVGLEIKRELIAGELSSPRQAALPIAGAIGGMIVPAAIFCVFNPTPPALNGWAVPMATDIAFALGALALIAPQAPTAAKVFLAALAIVDDMGAVLIIAIFYSGTIAWGSLGVAGFLGLLLVGLNAARVRQLWPYLVTGVALWFFVHQSGVHATIAGVALAFAIPTRTRVNALEFSRDARGLLHEFDRTETGDLLVLTSKGQQEALFALGRASEDVTAPLLRLEHALHKVTAFGIMPLFAFANAGVSLSGPVQHLALSFGVFAGLVIGKPLGITLAAWCAVKTGLAKLPEGLGWMALHGYSWLAGIGFTMSLFIALLAFDDAPLVEAAKRGILTGSLVAGLVAAVILRINRRSKSKNNVANGHSDVGVVSR